MVKLKNIEYINIPEARELFKEYGHPISRQAVYLWLNRYDITIKVMGRYLIDRQKLEDILKKRLKHD